MFVALVIQHEKCMRHIVICGLPGCTIFFHIISKMAGFSKKNIIGHEMCFLISSTTFAETFFIFRRNERDIIIYALRSSCKVPVICVGF